jgi:hypothetical protein
MTTAQAGRSCDGLEIPALDGGYIEREYLMSGHARVYTGPATGPVELVDVAERVYTTRILVRRPRNAAAFSGRVVIEPFNTSSGIDHDPLWCHVGTLLQRQGDAWVAVSTRAISQDKLKETDAARYADVAIASNDLAWDILNQLGALLRSAVPPSPLSDVAISRLYLGGFSQSATETATYAMAFGPQTRIFDGYFPAAHAASLTPVASGTAWIVNMDIAAMGACHAPVIDVEPQTDVEGFSAALTPEQDYVNPGGAWVRRHDSDHAADRYRLYEIAGAPHMATMSGCDGASDFPTSAFLRAALVRLFTWVEDGVIPPTTPRIALAQHDQISTARTDEIGNAVGGVRSPHLDVPLARYDVHASPGILCKLVGKETVLPLEELRRRHGDAEHYMREFARRLDEAIATGFLLDADRADLLRLQKIKADAAFTRLAGSRGHVENTAAVDPGDA